MFSTVLLARTREAFVATSGSAEAVRNGLRETAGATTGAGLLMIAALIPLSLTELLNIRALGIGVAVAVLLHLLIVRPVLLPAAAAVLRRYGWWPTAATRPGAPTHPHRRKVALPAPSLPHRRSRPAHP